MKRLSSLKISESRLGQRLVALCLFLLLTAGLAGCGNTTTLKMENDALKSRITTLSYNSYHSSDLGVSFSFPANWVRQDTQLIAPLFISPEGIANVGVTKEILPQAMTTDDYFVALNQQLQTKGYILCSVRQIQVQNSTGIQAVYLNKGLFQVFVVVAKGQTAWSLIETSKAEQFIDWAQTFNEIARSFKILY